MLKNDLIILYVKNTSLSTAFYTKLLDKDAFDSSENFACIPLNASTTLGLWSAHTVKPEVRTIGNNGMELTFALNDKESVDALYETWQKQNITIAQEPTQMEFGYTFTALDPDGHRLRAYYSSDCV